MTRLLNGLARFVQHPARDQIYLLHLGWSLFLLLAIVHFWWFEFGLQRIEIWTFEIYVFVICYAALLFFIGTILVPDKMDEYSGFAEYFHSRQKWFYGLLGPLFLADPLDTAIKGAEHFSSFGIIYPIRQLVLFALAMVVMFISSRRHHASFAILGIISEIYWILSQFQVLD
ncbi:MAG TPA: hypothetical protein VFE34_04195 [Dongiaceae bacterium]|nr:hypothetical protein [Dongiaceae bacterium]